MTILDRVGSWMARGGTTEWFEVLLVSVCEERDRVVNCRNRVDCEAMCGLMSCDKCMNMVCVNPFSPDVLCDVM